MFFAKNWGHKLRTLSKSKLLAYRQCPKRLWLEIHRPELREADIERQLPAYCALDTYAIVRLWSAFTGKAVS